MFVNRLTIQSSPEGERVMPVHKTLQSIPRDDFLPSENSGIIPVELFFTRSRAFYDLHSLSKSKNIPRKIHVSEKNALKVTLIYSKIKNGRKKKDKTITKRIESLDADEIKHFSPRFLESWSEFQVEAIPNDLFNELTFEQLKAVMGTMSSEKLFKNLKNIESKLDRKQIKKILATISNNTLGVLAERIATGSDEEIRYFSSLSSVTIFFFLNKWSYHSAKSVLDRLSLKKIKSLAEKTTNKQNLLNLCCCLGKLTYLKVVNNLSINQKIMLIQGLQKFNEIDRLFLMILGMTNEEILESANQEILRKLKADLPHEKKAFIEFFLEND